MDLGSYRAQKRSEKAVNTAHITNQMVITNETFFTEDNENGFISKEEFINHIDSLIDSEYAINALGEFFGNLSDGLVKLKISRFPWTNPQTNKQMFFVDFDSKVSRQYSVECFKGLNKLIDGYTHGKFNCALNLDELFKRAKGVQ